MLEKDINQMNDARLVNLAEHLLFPLLQRHLDEKVNALASKFRGGKEVSFLQEAAQIAYIQDLMGELKRVQQRGNKIIEKINQET